MDVAANLLSSLDWRFVTTITIPALVVVAGWFLTHWLNARRELVARKREVRLRSLESAYLRIATSSNRPMTDEIMNNLEMFVSEIQLYGTPTQIQLMSELVEGFKQQSDRVSYDEILTDLRDTIRKELNLEPIDGPVWWLRFGRNDKEKQQPTAKTSN